MASHIYLHSHTHTNINKDLDSNISACISKWLTCPRYCQCNYASKKKDRKMYFILKYIIILDNSMIKVNIFLTLQNEVSSKLTKDIWPCYLLLFSPFRGRNRYTEIIWHLKDYIRLQLSYPIFCLITGRIDAWNYFLPSLLIFYSFCLYYWRASNDLGFLILLTRIIF